MTVERQGYRSFQMEKQAAYCPECSSLVTVNDLLLGLLLTCPACKTDLEVIHLDPLQLDWTLDDSDAQYMGMSQVDWSAEDKEFDDDEADDF